MTNFKFNPPVVGWCYDKRGDVKKVYAPINDDGYPPAATEKEFEDWLNSSVMKQSFPKTRAYILQKTKNAA